MAIISKVEICNMALSHLGNDGTVTNIDTPTTKTEITFSLWYDITRQTLLKSIMPNFALSRKLVGELVTTIAFGYSSAYEYPNDCLKVLGLGNVDEKTDYIYAVEDNKIFSDDVWDSGLQLRYIKDVEEVSSFSPEFKILLAWVLASNVAMNITQDMNKVKLIEAIVSQKMIEYSGLNAQENRPIRISNSRFLQARDNLRTRNISRK